MEGVEPPTLWFVAIDSNPLSYIPDGQAFTSSAVLVLVPLAPLVRFANQSAALRAQASSRILALASAWLSPKDSQRALNSSALPKAKRGRMRDLAPGPR